MIQRLTGRKSLAMFILAFLCLNVGGAFCLTYCTQIGMAAPAASDADAHLSEHCRKATHAAEERNTDSSRIDANEASCCILPVAMFSAPVEKRTIGEAVMADAVTPTEFRYSAPTVSSTTTTVIPVYRPPPLDHSVDRILHCVIRI